MYLDTDLLLTADRTGADGAPGTGSHILQRAVAAFTPMQPAEGTSFSILVQSETEMWEEGSDAE